MVSSPRFNCDGSLALRGVAGVLLPKEFQMNYRHRDTLHLNISVRFTKKEKYLLTKTTPL